jgi:hypothetical protein
MGPCIGRPFVVEGHARLASVTARGDWGACGEAPAARGLSPRARERLAAYWLGVARLEHASIAAFARFCLQLLAVGAPPDLVSAAQQAMADETSHAQLAFALASGYAGRDLGPGPLSIDACLDATDVRALVAAVFVEGCIGETVAAIEATEALGSARDPAVRAALSKMAFDETRHAALAWRTVAWAMDAGEASVCESVEHLLAAQLASDRIAHPLVGSDPATDDEVVEHGMLEPGLLRRLRSAALADIVVPCARELIARARARAGAPSRGAA